MLGAIYNESEIRKILTQPNLDQIKEKRARYLRSEHGKAGARTHSLHLSKIWNRHISRDSWRVSVKKIVLLKIFYTTISLNKLKSYCYGQ